MTDEAQEYADAAQLARMELVQRIVELEAEVMRLTQELNEIRARLDP